MRIEETAVRTENLSKRYYLGRERATYRTFRDVLAQAFLSPLRRARRVLSGQGKVVANPNEAIWALRDVSLEIGRGEVVGIIGRNGAGKSTLLKVLSRITEPTRGSAAIRGRVGSLLEVGTGFHPELTGRENIYLNAAILGMRKTEVDRKFDEIVSFGEVEKFLDTPVKHYSTGMYLRLAFAVAAHLDSEILLVDEVLAVGDAAFQKKCLAKMEDVSQQGRTVLFVSHSMPAITRLCQRTILLDGGAVLRDGPSHQVVSTYLSSGLGTTAAREWDDVGRAPGTDVVRLRAARVRTAEGRVTDVIDIRQSVGIELEYEVLKPGHALWPCFTLHNEQGVFVCSAIDQDPAWRGQSRQPGRYVSVAWIPDNLLAEGTMIVGPAMRTMHPTILHFHERDAIAFQVVDSVEGDSARGDWAGEMPGVVRPLLRWTTEIISRGPRVLETRQRGRRGQG